MYIDYKNYPDDIQTIQVGVESFAFKTDLLNISFTPYDETIDGFSVSTLPPVQMVTVNFSPLWNYVSNSFEILYYDPYVPNYSRGVVYISVSRQSYSIVYRLAFPIMLLCMLVGLTFWSEYGSRVDTTITLLLAVSALYIVIFSSVPMLGYLTTFDTYIIGVSVCLK